MKKLVVTLMIVAFAATAAIAADSVVLENSKGNITFAHKTHGEKFGCDKCHATIEKKAGAIDGKKAGHDLCLACHKAENGPSKCGDCHKK